MESIDTELANELWTEYYVKHGWTVKRRDGKSIRRW
jgi:hypothetical protein